MKELKRITFFIILLFILPFVVNAATTLSASTQKPVVGTSFYIEINMNYGKTQTIQEAHLKVTYDTEFIEFEDVTWAQSRGVYSVSNGTIYIDKTSSTSSWQYGGQVIIKFKVLKSGQTKLSLEATKTSYFSDGTEIAMPANEMPGITITPVEPSSSTKIGTLVVVGYTLSPTFSKTKYNYTVVVPSDVTSVEVKATKGESNQTITGTGKRELEYGDNKVTVKVTAQNGASSSYEIIIKRTDNRTGDVTLKKLSVTNTDIEYVEGQTTYEATVSRSIDSVLITASTTDTNAILTGTGKKELTIGKNTFYLSLSTVDQKGKSVTQTYTIIITRSEEEFQIEESSSELQTLNINGLLLDLSDNKTTFQYGISKDINELSITATPKSKTAKVEITGNENLQNGLNLVTITVTETTEESTEYKIVVYKDPKNATVIQDISTTDFTEDKLYQTVSNADNIIPIETVKALKDSNKTLYYNVVNIYNGLISQIALHNNLEDKEIDATITKTSTSPLTYEINIPKDNEITLYLDDIYQDGAIIKIYSYTNSGEYTLITEGIKVENGYVTFTTNDDNHYVFTQNSLIKEQTALSKFISKYLTYIIAVIIILVAIIFIIYLKSKKEKQNNQNEPLY